MADELKNALDTLATIEPRAIVGAGELKRVETDVGGVELEVVRLPSGEELVTMDSFTRFLDSLNDNLNQATALLKDLRSRPDA